MQKLPNHVLETQQFKDRELLDWLLDLASMMETFDKKQPTERDVELCGQLMLPQKPRRKILANLFYEPSTRTRFSFSSAMRALGGDTVETEAAGQFSSVSKGETLPDTIRVVSGYADAIVLRHPQEGAAKEAAEYSSVPVINAGDGGGQHPTQALLDLYTIKKELGRVDNLTVVMVGDLKNGRTVHSLSYLLARMGGIRMVFVAPQQLAMRQDILDYLKRKGCDFRLTTDLKEAAREADVLYMTRVQKERFSSQEEYEKVKDAYILDGGVTAFMKEKSIIMHPLPRINEIAKDVDSDPRAAYFRQASNGKYVRMALLKMLLDPKGTEKVLGIWTNLKGSLRSK
jgi:aspartate carbamoyltransferase catalytic subunit